MGQDNILSKVVSAAKITAVGIAVPDRILTNKDMETMVDTTDHWIRTRTGIVQRHMVKPGECNSDLASRAARQVLQARGLDPLDIQMIIVATVTPDMFFPPTACIVQEKIGAKNAWGFDLSGACSGFLYALSVGAQFVSNGTCRKVLVIGSDVMSSIIDFHDRATCVLFGDAAGAVLLEPAEEGEKGIMDMILRSDGAGGKYLYMPGGGSMNPPSHETVDKKMHYVHQDGKTVFKFAVKGMADVSQEILARNGVDIKDLKLFVPHQANKRIIDACAEKLGVDQSVVLCNIERYANTTAATIPIGLYEAHQDKRIQKGDLIVLASFGAGFTWGSILLRWEMN